MYTCVFVSVSVFVSVRPCVRACLYFLCVCVCARAGEAYKHRRNEVILFEYVRGPRSDEQGTPLLADDIAGDGGGVGGVGEVEECWWLVGTKCCGDEHVPMGRCSFRICESCVACCFVFFYMDIHTHNIYVYIYLCICMHIYIYMNIYICKYIYIYTFIHI